MDIIKNPSQENFFVIFFRMGGSSLILRRLLSGYQKPPKPKNQKNKIIRAPKKQMGIPKPETGIIEIETGRIVAGRKEVKIIESDEAYRARKKDIKGPGG